MNDICVGSALAGNGCMKCSECKAELAKPATHSEDGGEVVGYLDHERKTFSPVETDDHRCPLIYLANFERIVAAKDAEIAWLKTDLPGDTVADRLDRLADHSDPGSQRQSDLYAAATVWRKYLSAQPARQVGDDERQAFLAWATNNWTGSTESAWKVWQARALLGKEGE